MDYQFKVKFENRKGKSEVIPASDLMKAIAIGKSWSKRETFEVFDMDGRRVVEYRAGSRVGREV